MRSILILIALTTALIVQGAAKAVSPTVICVNGGCDGGSICPQTVKPGCNW